MSGGSGMDTLLEPIAWTAAALSSIYFGAIWLVVRVGLRPPRMPLFLTPAALDCPQEDIAFHTADGLTLRGWWLPADVPKGCVVIAHGYLMNRCELSIVGSKLRQAGWDVLMFDLRAHGESQGQRCGMGWHEARDVEAAANLARSRSGDRPVVLLGSSMGGAASALALSKAPGLAQGMVMDSVYSQLPDAAMGILRVFVGRWAPKAFAPGIVLAWPMLGFKPWKVDLADHLPRVDCPVLMLHGSRDGLIPPDRARRNFEALPHPQGPIWFERAGHCEGRMLEPKRYVEVVLAFCNSVAGSGRSLERDQHPGHDQ